MKLQVVTWRDAHFDVDKATKRKDYLVKTVGWVSEGKRFLTIRGEKTPDGPRAITHVPLESIVKRRDLT